MTVLCIGSLIQGIGLMAGVECVLALILLLFGTGSSLRTIAQEISCDCRSA